MVSAAGLAARLGAGIMRAMAEHPKRPASIPEGLVVELSRGRVLPGASAEADRWMAMLNDRLEEAVATLDRERMAIEIVFRLREGDDEYLYWVSVRGAHGAGLDLQTPIDRDHEAQARRTKEPGWVEAEPQLLLLPDPVRRAVLEWALRGRATSQQRSEAATGDVVAGDASPEAGTDSGGAGPVCGATVGRHGRTSGV